MKIEAMEIPNQGPDRDRTDAWVKIGDEIAVEIQAIGSATYRWKAHAMVGNDGRFSQSTVDAVLDPVMGDKDQDGYYGPGSFGQPGVYLEPKTFAHAVFDVVRNG